jgi:hypothetical protein
MNSKLFVLGALLLFGSGSSFEASATTDFAYSYPVCYHACITACR